MASLFRESSVKNRGLAETNLLSLSYGRVVRKDIGSSEGLLPESFETYQIVEPDTLVFRFTDLQNDQRSLRSARATERGIITSAYCAATPTGINARYAEHLMRSYDLMKVFYSFGGGVRQSLKFSDVARMTVLLPPRAEQEAIADYLDRETTQIDTLIAKQELLIDRLQERRLSIVTSVLRSGLPSNLSSATKPHDPPVVPARHLCRITTGSKDSGSAIDEGGYPFFVRGREILRSPTFSFDGEAVLTPGDGQGGTGKVFHYARGKFEAHQRVYVFTDFRGVTGWYFYYYLSTFLGPVALAGANTVTMESIRRPVLMDFPVLVPALDEQIRITDRLDAETTKIDALIAKAEQFIALSKERRAALITAAVTGQLEIQGVAA